MRGRTRRPEWGAGLVLRSVPAGGVVEIGVYSRLVGESEVGRDGDGSRSRGKAGGGDGQTDDRVRRRWGQRVRRIGGEAERKTFQRRAFLVWERSIERASERASVRERRRATW